jgi:hypothetical protein
MLDGTAHSRHFRTAWNLTVNTRVPLGYVSVTRCVAAVGIAVADARQMDLDIVATDLVARSVTVQPASVDDWEILVCGAFYKALTARN